MGLIAGTIITILSIGASGVVVQKTTSSRTSYACMGDCGSPPDLLEKETWECKGSKLVLTKTDTGQLVHPPRADHEEWDKK